MHKTSYNHAVLMTFMLFDINVIGKHPIIGTLTLLPRVPAGVC